MKLILAGTALALALLTLSMVGPASAQTPTPVCQPIFGGGETCTQNGNLIINKSIKHPTTGAYVETIAQDIYFSPNQDITFRINVVNNNNTSVSNITITDKFPALLTYTGGAGKFETATRTLTIPLEKLNGNEAKSFIITARIAGSDRFSREQPITCLANQSQVKAGNRFSTDNVQFCVQTGEIPTPSVQPTPAQGAKTFTTPQPQPQTKPQPAQGSTTKGGLPVHPAPQTTHSPNTGPELLGLIGLLPAGIGGYLLRRKSSV